METTAERLPEWLNRWLNLPFYSGSRAMCDKHPKKFNTVYCASCSDQRPVCLTCWKLVSDQHVGDRHHVLEVLKASRRVSIVARKIRKFLNVSEIQLYSINGNDIVFLNPNQEASPPLADHVVPKCRTCRRRLIKEQDKFGYQFCSIACKYPRREDDHDHLSKKTKKCDADAEKSSSGIKIKLPKKRKSVSIPINDDDECCPPSTPPSASASASASGSLRKRPRKGVRTFPQRAPFM